MFDIEYKGGNTVIVTTKKVSMVFDPKLSIVGLKDVSVKDGIQVATEQRFSVEDAAYRLKIDGPGEYEIGDMSLRGTAAQRHIDTAEDLLRSTVYQLEIAGVKIAILGNIAPNLSEDQQEAIGVVDIVILPVGGGGYTLDATAAATLVRQLEPRVVIPVHYADSALTYEVPQDTLEVFTSELGAPVEDNGSKYKLKTAAGLPQVLTVIPIARS